MLIRRGDSFPAKRFGSWCRFPRRRSIPVAAAGEPCGEVDRRIEEPSIACFGREQDKLVDDDRDQQPLSRWAERMENDGTDK
jgi:hypothetical protein